MFRIKKPSALVVFLLAIAGVLHAGTIGLDRRNGDSVHNLATGSGTTGYRACITALGHDTVPLDTFLAADLAGLDAIILHHPVFIGKQLTASETDAIHAFVAAGGGLLYHSTGGLFGSQLLRSVHSLTEPYGIVYDSIRNSPDGLEIVDLVFHPVTSGVTSFGVDYQRSLTTSAPGLDLTTGSGNQDALAVRDGTGGAGNVAMLSDITGFTDAATEQDYSIDDLDTKLLLQNLIGYITSSSTECFLVIGDTPGLTPYVGAAHVFETQVGPTIEASFAVTMRALPEFALPAYSATGVLSTGSSTGKNRLGLGAATPGWMQDGHFTVQVLMWNPQAFPGQPEQCTAGLEVQVLAGGHVVTTPYGVPVGGMDIWAEVITGTQGQKLLRFPFTISGL